MGNNSKIIMLITNDKITSNNKVVEKACLKTLRVLSWT